LPFISLREVSTHNGQGGWSVHHTQCKSGGTLQTHRKLHWLESQDRDSIFLTLGNSTDVDFALTESGTQLQEILVLSSKSDVFNSDRTGASTNISKPGDYAAANNQPQF